MAGAKLAFIVHSPSTYRASNWHFPCGNFILFFNGIPTTKELPLRDTLTQRSVISPYANVYVHMRAVLYSCIVTCTRQTTPREECARQRKNVNKNKKPAFIHRNRLCSAKCAPIYRTLYLYVREYVENETVAAQTVFVLIHHMVCRYLYKNARASCVYMLRCHMIFGGTWCVRSHILFVLNVFV